MFDSPLGPRYADVSPDSEDTAIPKSDLLELVYAYGELRGIDHAEVNRIVEETIIKEPAYGEPSCLARQEKKKPQREIRAGYNYTW